jgi:hypothetical protein
LKCDLASNKIAAATRITVTAVPAVPADTDALPCPPSRDAGAYRVNDSGDLVTWDTRVLDAWQHSFLSHDIAVANAASLHPDSYGSGDGIGYRPLNDLEGPMRAGDLYHAHRRHDSPNLLLSSHVHPQPYCTRHRMTYPLQNASRPALT